MMCFVNKRVTVQIQIINRKQLFSSKFFNLFDNFESLLRGIGAKFTNLKDMTLNGIKSMPSDIIII